MSRGWLSREDFAILDELFGKLGYGGYYDFLLVLKDIASKSGAIHFIEDGEIRGWDLEDIKTIPELVSMLLAWSNKVLDYREKNPDYIDKILGSGDVE